MMSGRFTVVGSIGAEPERRAAKDGGAFLTFSVASNERRQDGNGVWADAGTSWFDVRAFGALARNAGDMLHRGDRVIVLGDLTVDQYEKTGGGKGVSVRIRATAIGRELTMGARRTSSTQATEQSDQTGASAGTGTGTDAGAGATTSGWAAASQVDHSGEWAPVAVDEPRPALTPQSAEAGEPEWMSTPF